MSTTELDEVRRFWNRVAGDWRTQVGDEGDANRRWNSDPVLWALLGDVQGRVVLDAGCGTGYLSSKLTQRGARVIGVDLAEEMIAIARRSYPGISFRVDSISSLATVGNAEIDAVVSNYVLMDNPDLDGATTSFFRVLRPGGCVVVVFSHPCFPQGRATVADDGGRVTYDWDFPYFEPQRCRDEPWAHFTTEFIWFHRPLSDYWKAFRSAGFHVVDFEEPRASPERLGPEDSTDKYHRNRARPYSVVFKLRKPA